MDNLINVMRIAITGTPGTGKDTIAEMLAEKMKIQALDIGKLAIDKKYGKKDKERDTFEVDIKKLSKELKGKQGIFVSNWAELIPNDITIVLRCEPKELARRLKKRKWPEAKIKENLEAECLDSCLISAIENAKKAYEVDNTKEKEKTVDAIIRLIKKKPKPDYSISWIEKVEKAAEYARDSQSKRA
jgi:adenylate kinase